MEKVEPPPKRPRVTDQAIGRASFALSVFGSLCVLAYILSSVIDPHNRWDDLWGALVIGGTVGFFAAFFVGIVGWHSWEGKVGLCSAVIGPPLWFVVNWLFPWS